jgi:hypothetical protein
MNLIRFTMFLLFPLNHNFNLLLQVSICNNSIVIWVLTYVAPTLLNDDMCMVSDTC